MQITIIGGGLAGLVSATHLAQAGMEVLVLEKHRYPRHKVCGEYISNEVLPYLNRLGIDPFEIGATAIGRVQLTNEQGKAAAADLPLGGFGISRYTLDEHLRQCAVEAGAEVRQATVQSVHWGGHQHLVTLKSGETIPTPIVIGAYGKRSNLDKQLQRSFIQQQAPYLAVKGHYAGDFPADLVALHHFRGGYCGVSKVEEGWINICFIADYSAFKQHRDIDAFREQVLCRNPHLRRIFSHVTPRFSNPLSISQISFLPKPVVDQHVFMAGDAAGMIHPLCGNGMGMAISSAELLAELLLGYAGGDLGRAALEQAYARQWQRAFRRRLLAGRLFNALFRRPSWFGAAMGALTLLPGTLPFFIRQTHG